MEGYKKIRKTCSHVGQEVGKKKKKKEDLYKISLVGDNYLIISKKREWIAPFYFL